MGISRGFVHRSPEAKSAINLVALPRPNLSPLEEMRKVTQYPTLTSDLKVPPSSDHKLQDLYFRGGSKKLLK